MCIKSNACVETYKQFGLDIRTILLNESPSSTSPTFHVLYYEHVGDNFVGGGGDGDADRVSVNCRDDDHLDVDGSRQFKLRHFGERDGRLSSTPRNANRRAHHPVFGRRLQFRGHLSVASHFVSVSQLPFTN